MEEDFLDLLTRAKLQYRHDGSWVRELAAIITRKHPSLRLRIDDVMRNQSTIVAPVTNKRTLREWTHPDAIGRTVATAELVSALQPGVQEKKNTLGSVTEGSAAPILVADNLSNADDEPAIDMATCSFDEFLTLFKNRKGIVTYMESIGILDTKGNNFDLWEKTKAYIAK